KEWVEHAVRDRMFSHVSAERLWSELKKALGEPALGATIEELRALGFFEHHPELAQLFRALSREILSVYAERAVRLPHGERVELLRLLLLSSLVVGDEAGISASDRALLGKLGIGKRELKRLLA